MSQRRTSKASPNPAPRRRRPGVRRAARPAARRTPNPAPRRKRRRRNPRQTSMKLSHTKWGGVKAHKRRVNPMHAMQRRRKRRRNPDASLMTMIVAAGAGGFASVTISSIARGMLAKAVSDPMQRSAIADASAAAIGGAAYWWGHKKNISWLKWGGLGCLFTSIGFLVRDTAGRQIETQTAKLFTGASAAAVTSGYRRLGVQSTQGFQQNHQVAQQSGTRMYGY